MQSMNRGKSQKHTFEFSKLNNNCANLWHIVPKYHSILAMLIRNTYFIALKLWNLLGKLMGHCVSIYLYFLWGGGD